MKHKITVTFTTIYNIVCAAAAFYEECQREMPQIFDEKDADELKTAIKLRRFFIETSANSYKIEDAK